MNVTIQITGADIDEQPGKIVSPDYPVEFSGEVGEISIHDLAQTKGSELWTDMHGEKPLQVYYRALS